MHFRIRACALHTDRKAALREAELVFLSLRAYGDNSEESAAGANAEERASTLSEVEDDEVVVEGRGHDSGSLTRPATRAGGCGHHCTRGAIGAFGGRSRPKLTADRSTRTTLPIGSSAIFASWFWLLSRARHLSKQPRRTDEAMRRAPTPSQTRLRSAPGTRTKSRLASRILTLTRMPDERQPF
ncbi:hypothetical protein PLICRDRAFT_689345 [Plicaturopsis crispa FD-325 SS-3]|nr:hypothetical protein PLICRDRAFT_689345 [Plicaturopsis crispa FD-325 SS-3]